MRRREIFSLIFSAFAVFNIVWFVQHSESVFYLVGSIFLIISCCCIFLQRVVGATTMTWAVIGDVLCAMGLVAYSAIVVYKAYPDFFNDVIVLVGMVITLLILWLAAIFGIFTDTKRART